MDRTFFEKQVWQHMFYGAASGGLWKWSDIFDLLFERLIV